MKAGEAKEALRLVSSNPNPDIGEASTAASTTSPVKDTNKPETDPKKAMVSTGGRWARYAGKLGAALTVTGCGVIIRKGGREPHEPDDDDVVLLQEALEEGLRLKYGDGEVPWWLGASLAAGGVYAGMRIGAPKVAPPEAKEEVNPDDGREPGQDIPRENQRARARSRAELEDEDLEQEDPPADTTSRFANIRPQKMRKKTFN